uniref:Uncharacterized protein n=1 Tax=Yersinia enterocolitica TaxID=630 RepID=B0RL41_YEREN|nr:hypothetical protein [Yersinia enterocolitica]
MMIFPRSSALLSVVTIRTLGVMTLSLNKCSGLLLLVFCAKLSAIIMKRQISGIT